MSITPLTRSAVYGYNGMICSNSPLAASAGLRVLQDGGTAFDAALAVAAVEAVTIVPSNGLGGDSFILAYEAATGKVTNINSSGVAAAGAEAEYYRSQGLALMPIQGPHSVSVPGEAAAWETMYRNFCTMPFADLLAPAIRYAEEVFRCRRAWPAPLPATRNCWPVFPPPLTSTWPTAAAAPGWRGTGQPRLGEYHPRRGRRGRGCLLPQRPYEEAGGRPQ